MKKIGIAFTFIIIIGVISVCLTELGYYTIGTESALLTKQAVPSFSNLPQAQQIYWYKIDLVKYANNLAYQIDIRKWINYAPETPPEIKFTALDGWTLGITAIGKCFCWLVNWLQYISYFALIFPIKVLVCYPFTVISAIFGFDNTEIGNALLQLYNYEPPYIPVDWGI